MIVLFYITSQKCGTEAMAIYAVYMFNRDKKITIV